MAGIDLLTVVASIILVLIGIPLLYFLIGPMASTSLARNPWAKFPNNSLRLKTLDEAVRAKGYTWILKRMISKTSLKTYWSFIWVLPAGLGLAFSLAYLTALWI